jgi:hypothetical protein
VPAREDQKKPDEEMLIVHKPGPKPDPKKVGAAPAALPRAASLDKQELELMKKQLGMTKEPGVRRELLSRIQAKFGNDKATEVVRELRLKPPDDEPKQRPDRGGGSKKGKA